MLDDIGRGLVDIVLVYKVDRLTRSLGDFARIVDQFDKAGVSFVSVTQAFNTTSSMGRLTLNVLLSFAQFEREVTGERIRDKISQSKAKGMWMGGTPPLGYAPPTDRVSRKLTVIETEAGLVRAIYRAYLELGSVTKLERKLAADGARSKAWVTSTGKFKGGCPFSRGQLFHLLRNRVYRGEIVHQAGAAANAHPAIVDKDTFDAVQAMLSANHARRVDKATSVATAPLKGKLFDRAGRPMSPVFAANRHGKTYRYYVSSPLQSGKQRRDDPTLLRLSAQSIEDLLEARLARLFPAAGDLASIQRASICEGGIALLLRGNWVTPRGQSLSEALQNAEPHLELGESLERTAKSDLTLILRVHFKVRGGRTVITKADGRSPILSTRQDATLMKALQRAHQIASAHGLCQGAAAGQTPSAPENPYSRKLARLVFLSPDIQTAILEGNQPRGLSAQDLMAPDLPLSWSRQRALFGL